MISHEVKGERFEEDPGRDTIVLRSRSQPIDDWLHETARENPLQDPDQRSMNDVDRSLATSPQTGSRITSRPREVIKSLGHRRVQMQPTDDGFLGDDLCNELFRGRHEEPVDLEGLKLDAKLSRFCNEAGIVRANSPFLTPTPISLRWQESFITSGNDTLWLGVPPMGHKIPKPDLQVGLARESLDDEQRAKYEYFIETYPAADIPDTLFPFLICEAKADQGLESANRRCTHAAAIAVRCLLFLHACVYGMRSQELQDLFGQPLVFSIAYDAVRVEIYAHFAVLDNDGRSIEYRRTQRAFFNIEYPNHRDFLVAWHFVLSLYETFAITRRDMIHKALNDLQPGEPPTTGLSSMFPGMTGSSLPPAWTNKWQRPEQGDDGELQSLLKRLEESEKENQALREQMSLGWSVRNPAGASFGTPVFSLDEGGRRAASTVMSSPQLTMDQDPSGPVRFKLWHNGKSFALSVSRETSFEDFQTMVGKKLNVRAFVMKAGTTILNDIEDLSMVIEENQGGRIEVWVPSEGTVV